ncbi:MAG: hypothetical protein V3U71_12460 [Cocleimonas sp.]
MRILVLLSMLLMLTSCSKFREPKVMPDKTFQYSYKSPARSLANSALSKQLSSGKKGSAMRVKLKGNQVSAAKLGRKYFSASGHECRTYIIQSSDQYSACKIGGRWYKTSPIIIYK